MKTQNNPYESPISEEIVVKMEKAITVSGGGGEGGEDEEW